MKHDLEAFSRDIVTLIKTSGDSGGSGDKLKKSLRERDNFVPTRLQLVSPLKNEWGQPCAASGDRKTKQFESVTRSVPTVPTVPTHFRQGPDEPAAGAAPPEWYAILAGLERPAPRLALRRSMVRTPCRCRNLPRAMGMAAQRSAGPRSICSVFTRRRLPRAST